jgi:hypothetical protein
MRTFAPFIFCAPLTLFAQAPVISSTSTAVQEGQTATITCTANCTSLTWKVNGITGGNYTTGTIAASGSTATYIAPVSIVAQNVVGGCQVYPNDSVFNTPVSTLPYLSSWHGNSFLNDSYFINYLSAKGFQHLSMTSGIGTSLVNNSTSVLPFQSLYGNYVDNIPFPAPPALKRESGSYDNNGNNDHHSSIINTDNGQLHEVYNDQPTKDHCLGDPNGTTNCWHMSSSVTNVTLNNTYTWTGGTNAANEPLTPLLPHLSEIKAGVINHAMRFALVRGWNPNSPVDATWPATGATGLCSPGVVGLMISNGGSGYAAGTTATISGGHGSGATVILAITVGVIIGYKITNIGSGYIFPDPGVTVTLGNTGGGTGAVIKAIVDWPCPPYGARYVLDPTYLARHTGATCSAGTKCLTGAGLVVATALANYGMLMTDNTCCGIFSTYGSQDIGLDLPSRNSINSALGTLSISDFHIVDETGLAKNSVKDNNTACSGGPCPISQVLPGNTAGLTPPGAIWITAANASGTSNTLSLIAQATTIGTPSPVIDILAGDYSGTKGTSGGYQIPVWVHGNANSGYSCAMELGANGTITPDGIYTPPASVSTTGLQDVATCTTSADLNAKAVVYINILPNAGNYAANTIRIDVGNGANYGPDGNGHYWIADTGAEFGDKSGVSDAWPYYKGTGELAVYQNGTWSRDNIQYTYIVPNGNYRVRVMSGWDTGTAQISDTAWNHMPMMIVSTDVGQGVIEGLHWNMMAAAAIPYATDSNSDFTFGTKVTDNTLPVIVTSDAVYPHWSCGTEGFGTCFHQPELSGIDIEPDSTSAHWAIGITNGVPTTNATKFLSDSPIVSVGGKLALYLQDWYTGLNDPVWSIVRGRGTLSPATQQLGPSEAVSVAQYTAPTSSRDLAPVIIKAKSQSNPSISATRVLYIQDASK